MLFSYRTEKGKHDLILTNFETATYCNFCGKKVNLLIESRHTCMCIIKIKIPIFILH